MRIELPTDTHTIQQVRQALFTHANCVPVVWAESEFSSDLYTLQLNEVELNGVRVIFFIPNGDPLPENIRTHELEAVAA